MWTVLYDALAYQTKHKLSEITHPRGVRDFRACPVKYTAPFDFDMHDLCRCIKREALTKLASSISIVSLDLFIASWSP